MGTTNRRVWERGTVLCGNEDRFHLGTTKLFNRCLATKEKACRVWEQKLFGVGKRICIARRNRIVLIDLEE